MLPCNLIDQIAVYVFVNDQKENPLKHVRILFFTIIETAMASAQEDTDIISITTFPYFVVK